MPLLTDENRITELRKMHPFLTHTSWRSLTTIEPHPNVDKHSQNLGNIVCATSSPLDRDFYALRCNETREMINWSVPFLDKDKKNLIFIFEKIKDNYYEHTVSSQNFCPIVSDTGEFSGEWISYESITPIEVKKGSKNDLLGHTSARIYRIVKKELFKESLKKIHSQLKDPETSLSIVNGLVQDGILKQEKRPFNLLNIRNQTR